MDKLSWSIRVPLLKNNIIRNQLGLALGIPFGILLIILMLVQAWGGLAIVGETLIMGFCFVMFIFRGTYDVQYVLDEKGIICETQNPQKNGCAACRSQRRSWGHSQPIPQPWQQVYRQGQASSSDSFGNEFGKQNTWTDPQLL